MLDSAKQADTARLADFKEVFANSAPSRTCKKFVPAEVPVAIEFNGIAYAVMMATPDNLDEFVTGFAITEELITSPSQIGGIDSFETDKGWIVRANLSGDSVESLFERARARVAECSCGLCGIENLEKLNKPLRKIKRPLEISCSAIFNAQKTFYSHQVLGQRTAAVHGAAFCSLAGDILLVREDVGRHNALDKLIGALAGQASDCGIGFFLLSARCSYELVEKTVIAGGRALVTISAPTTMALDRAAQAGLRLHVVARDDSVLSQ